jgi:hypothetical protein
MVANRSEVPVTSRRLAAGFGGHPRKRGSTAAARVILARWAQRR